MILKYSMDLILITHAWLEKQSILNSCRRVMDKNSKLADVFISMENNGVRSPITCIQAHVSKVKVMTLKRHVIIYLII